MSIVLDDLTARLDTLTKAVLSQPLARIGCSRVTIRPLSLRGKALPIGGVKEKLLAAYRAGMNTVLLPEEIRKDLEKLPENVRSAMQIQTISDASEAIATVMPGRKTTHVKAVI